MKLRLIKVISLSRSLNNNIISFMNDWHWVRDKDQALKLAEQWKIIEKSTDILKNPLMGCKSLIGPKVR